MRPLNLRKQHYVPDLARAYCDGGARLLQVRAKPLASGAFLAIVDQVVQIARRYGATVIVNAEVSRAPATLVARIIIPEYVPAVPAFGVPPN